MIGLIQYTQSIAKIWFILAIIWTIIWKGFSLWKAAHRDEKVWYIALLVVNTLGILEILYLFVFSKHSHVRKYIRKNKAQKNPTA